jgi:hypothetical protein
MQQNYLPHYAMWSRARGRRANLTGDLALVEYGLGGEIGVVGRQRVHIDGVAPLVPAEESFPERRQWQRAAREEHEGHLGHAGERVLAHPRREGRPPEQFLVRHIVSHARRRARPPLQPIVGLLLHRAQPQARPEQRGRHCRHRVPRHVHADGGQPHAEQQESQEHLEHPRREHPAALPLRRRRHGPLPSLFHVLHGRHPRLHRGRDSRLGTRSGGIPQI